MRFGLSIYFTVTQNECMKKTISILAVLVMSQSIFAVIPNRQTINDQILRGGRPSNTDLDQLKSEGYKTVISFENDAKVVAVEKTYAEHLGLKFISSPIDPWLMPDDVQINQILKVMSEPKNSPLFVHCQHGRDRTGLISGLYRVLNQKWNAQNAHDEMLALGFRKIFKNMDNYFWKKTK